MARQRATRRKQIVPSSSSGSDDDETPIKQRRNTAKGAKPSPRKNLASSSATSSQQKITSIFESPSKASSQKLESPKTKKSPKKSSANEKTLHSYFNAAIPSRTQISQSSQLFSPEIFDDDDILDFIEDGSHDENANVPTTTAPSIIASVAQKRNISARENSDDEYATAGNCRPKFFKNASGDRVSVPVSRNGQNTSAELLPWTERFPPLHIDELAVHKKKVADVKDWLSDTFMGKNNQKVLVLKGPAGTGKTTTLSLLSDILDFDTQQWRNPTNTGGSGGLQSASAQFEDFVARAGRYQSLELAGASRAYGTTRSSSSDPSRKQIVLIEEFPSSFNHSSPAVQAFRRTILQYLSFNNTTFNLHGINDTSSTTIVPIVIVISETLVSSNSSSLDSFTAHRLLGPELLNHPALHTIEFNPIAPTILSKALDLVVLKEARKSGRKRTPGPKVIASLAEVGDVRSAISSLQFLCVRGDEADYWSGKVNFTKNKKINRSAPLTQAESDSIQLVTQRESSLGLFHAVGKIVYNKRIEASDPSIRIPQPPPYLPQHARNKQSEVDVEKLVDELGSDIQTFIAALHENYVLSCDALNTEETLDCINGCLEALSDADVMSPDRFSTNAVRSRNFQGTSSDSLRQSEITFQSSVRGIIFSLPSPVKRITPPQLSGQGNMIKKADAFKMFYPSYLRIWRQVEECEGTLDMWIGRIQRGYDFKLHKNKQKGFAHGFSKETVNDVQHKKYESTEENAGIDGPVLLAGGNSARHEALLERLPYIALVLRSGWTNLPKADRESINKLTRFTGVSTSSSENPENEEDDEEYQERSKETALRKKADLRQHKSKQSAEKVDISKLVLSDDDIED